MRSIIRNVLLLLLLNLIGVIYFIGFTEKGLRILTPLITKYSPGQLTIAEVQGKLFSEFSFNHITYHTNEQDIHIKSIKITWRPSALLRDKLLIEKLVLDEPLITLGQTKRQGNSDFNLSWLKHIVLQQFVIKQLLIKYAESTLKFDGVLTDKWDASWLLIAPNLNHLNARLAGSFSSSGHISGELITPFIDATMLCKNFEMDNRKIHTITGKMKIDLHPNTYSSFNLNSSGMDLKTNPLLLDKAKLLGQIHFEKGALITDLNLTLANHYFLSALITLPKFTSFTDLKQPLNGTLSLKTTNLRSLAKLLPDIEHLRGAIQGKVLLGGVINKPSIKAELNLIDAHAKLKRLGITLDKFNLNAKSDDNALIVYQGSFNTNQAGYAQLNGSINLDQKPIPVALNLQGHHLQIMHLKGYNIIASPNIALHYTQNTMKLTGDILVDSADISVKNFSNTVTLPDEVVFTDKTNNGQKLPFNTTMDINLRLGNHVHFAYSDLKTDLSGQIQLLQNLQGSINATGELRAIKGSYNAYGQELKIKDGRLIFTGGSLINPGLNIRATKEIKTVVTEGQSNFMTADSQSLSVYNGMEKVTLGVQLLGTFDNLKVSLFSIPGGMSQNDILSYLALGHPASQATSKQLLLTAASALPLGKKSKMTNVTKKLQNKFGLSELDVASTESFDPTTGKVVSTTSLVVGKKLAPNLYAHYSKSIFNAAQTLNLRYKLSKRFAIQSETSTVSNGADLLYSIERD